MMDSRNFTGEIRIMERGGYYLTPFKEDHVYEFIHITHPENIKELLETGHYKDVLSALKDLTRKSEVYLVRDKNDEIIFTEGNTKALVDKRFKFDSKNVNYSKKTKQLTSKDKSTIKDKNGNTYKVDNFNYQIDKNK